MSLIFVYLKLMSYKTSLFLQIVLYIKFSLYITENIVCFHWKDQFKTIFSCLLFPRLLKLGWFSFLRKIMAAFFMYYTNHVSKLSGDMVSFECLTMVYMLTNNCKMLRIMIKLHRVRTCSLVSGLTIIVFLCDRWSCLYSLDEHSKNHILTAMDWELSAFETYDFLPRQWETFK